MKKILFPCLLLLITAIFRLPVFFHDFWDVDESQFAGFAHVLLDGGLPYRDSLDTKPLLIYLYYAFCFLIFGKYAMWGVHLVSLIVSWATGMGLYRIGRRHSETAGKIAAVFFVIFATAGLPKLIGTSITSVMILPLTWSFYFWIKGVEGQKKSSFFIAGLLAGTALLFKYQAGIQIAVFGLHALWLYRRGRPYVEGINSFLITLIAFLFPFAIHGIALYTLGVWPDFVEWSLKGSARYIEAGTQTIPFWENFMKRGGLFALFTLPLWILGVSGWMKKRDAGILLWFLLSWVSVCTGGRFYGHYFLQVLPPLCLMAAWGWSEFSKYKKGFILLLPPLVAFGLRVDFESVDKRFPDDQIFQQERVGKWIKEKSLPTQSVFVWGFATAIYFHAERKPASRFLWTDLLTGKVPGSDKTNQKDFDTSGYAVPQAWGAFWEDMRKHEPVFFVDTSTANIHNYGKYPLDLYPPLKDYLLRNYSFYAEVEGVTIYKSLKSQLDR